MKTTATFSEVDTGLTVDDLNITVKNMVGAVVDTTGWSMTESQRGSYEVEVPLAAQSGTIYLVKKTDATVFYDGFMGGASDPWLTEVPNGYVSPQAGYVVGRLEAIVDQFTAAIGALMASTYVVGQMSNPYAITPGGSIQIYTKANYKGISTVGEKWAALLGKYGSKVFFTAKSATDGTIAIDAECTITDSVAGVIDVTLTRAQTNVKSGHYFWQLEVRTYIDGPTPTLEDVWMMQEGTLQMKTSFKLW